MAEGRGVPWAWCFGLVAAMAVGVHLGSVLTAAARPPARATVRSGAASSTRTEAGPTEQAPPAALLDAATTPAFHPANGPSGGPAGSGSPDAEDELDALDEILGPDGGAYHPPGGGGLAADRSSVGLHATAEDPLGAAPAATPEPPAASAVAGARTGEVASGARTARPLPGTRNTRGGSRGPLADTPTPLSGLPRRVAASRRLIAVDRGSGRTAFYETAAPSPAGALRGEWAMVGACTRRFRLRYEQAGAAPGFLRGVGRAARRTPFAPGFVIPAQACGAAAAPAGLRSAAAAVVGDAAPQHSLATLGVVHDDVGRATWYAVVRGGTVAALVRARSGAGGGAVDTFVLAPP